MSLQSRLSELERRHDVLEQQLTDALNHPSTDDSTIADLKRRKLVLKDEIVRLKADPSKLH